MACPPHHFMFPAANGDEWLVGVCACGATQRCPSSLDDYSHIKGTKMVRIALKPIEQTVVFRTGDR